MREVLRQEQQGLLDRETALARQSALEGLGSQLMQPHATALTLDDERDQFDVLEIVFILSAFISQLRLSVFRAFTAYDMVTALLAFLIVAGPRRMRRTPSSLWIAGFCLLLAGLISAFRSTYSTEAAYQVLQFAFIFLIQLPVILTLARSRRTIHAALLMSVVGYLIVVLIAMVHQVQVAGRVVPFFEATAGALGIPTAFLGPLVIYFALDQWRKGRRSLVLVSGSVISYIMLWGLIASASRGAAAATGVSLAVFIVFHSGFELGRRLLLRIGLLVLAVIILAGIVYGTNVFPSTLEERIAGTLTTEQEVAVVDERTALDRAGIRAFLASPLIGTGFDNFRYVAQFYDDEATFHDPHNLWIQFLAQTGILGAGAFLFIIVRWFVLMLRTQFLASIPSGRELLWAFIAAMAGIMTHSMLAPLVLHRYYWLIYGLGISAAIQAARVIATTDRPQAPQPGIWIPHSSGPGSMLSGLEAAPLEASHDETRSPIDSSHATARNRGRNMDTTIESDRPLSILHVVWAVRPTTTQYNEHCLPVARERQIAVCSYFKASVEPPPEITLFQGKGTLISFWRALGASLDDRSYDVVHVHAPQTAVLLLLFSLKRRGIIARSLCTVHNSFGIFSLRNQALLHLVFAFFPHIVLCSAAALESLPWWLRLLGRGSMTIVPNGADTDRVDRALATPDVQSSDGAFTVVSVGRLIERKNPSATLYAFERYQGSDAKLIFVGDGDMRPWLLQKAEQLQLANRITFTGMIGREDVYRLLAQADVFVSTSRGEGLPIAVLEAMACRCPVILSDIPPHREVAGGHDFIPLLAPDDVDGFARELGRFRQMSNDERAELGERCRKVAEERFSLKTMHRNYESLYRKIMRKNAPSR